MLFFILFKKQKKILKKSVEGRGRLGERGWNDDASRVM